MFRLLLRGLFNGLNTGRMRSALIAAGLAIIGPLTLSPSALAQPARWLETARYYRHWHWLYLH